MRRELRFPLLVGVLAALSACAASSSGGHRPPASATPAPPTAPTAPSPAAPAAPPASPAVSSVSFVKDDLPAALKDARAQGKLVFVDAWALWCHTCLSMKNFVLNQPSLKQFESSIVFVALDTEREENQSFVDKYAMDVWPTLFVIDPEKEDLLGYWPGAASLREVEHLLSEAVALFELRRSGKLKPNSPEALLLRAKAAQSEDKHSQAADLYAAALKAAPADWSRRSEVLFGLIKTLHHARRAKECVEVGDRHATQVQGAARPADFTRFWFSCARGLPVVAQKNQARARAIAHLEKLLASPSAESSADDIGDAWEILADARRELGDEAGAKRAHTTRLALLEKAAADAPSPSAAATFDYARATSYVALGRAADAVTMLKERVTQLPDSYEPSARLASLLFRMNRHAEAKEAIDRTLKLAYGPRRLSYLALKANISEKLGDKPGQLAALEEEVAEWKKLAERQGSAPSGLKDAERRLAAARGK